MDNEGFTLYLPSVLHSANTLSANTVSANTLSANTVSANTVLLLLFQALGHQNARTGFGE